mmetsp:Transcript_56215/g.130971  ORF Transcript_56215/g.130971 Transcript_56215/m.130971 type:complete len:304 (-) Transcript_56215:84-995(-)
MAGPPVLYECADGVALITLNRPDSMNTWTEEISNAWLDAYDQAAADPKCRVIVITGKGRAWCAGADVTRLPGSRKAPAGSEPQPRQEQPRKAQPVPQDDPRVSGILKDGKGRDTIHALSIPKPIIACIQGAVAGGGFSQMMNCDVRFAASGVTFTTAFSRRGLIAEMGVSRTLSNAVGMGVAMDLILSGRKFQSEEALKLGIVQQVFPKDELLPATLAYARDMAANVPPSSMAVLKQQLLRHYAMPMDQVLRESNRLMMDSFRHPEHKEGVRSYLEKRSPKFAPFSEQHGLVTMMRDMQNSRL